MRAEWREHAFGELLEIRHGYAFRGEHFTEKPTPNLVLTPGNFAVGGGFQVVRKKYYEGTVPAEYVLLPGELVVTMTDLSKDADTLGYPAILPSLPAVSFLHNQRIGRVVIREPDLVDRRFLFYAMRTEDYRAEVLASATGTTVKHTAPDRILRYRTLVPPIAEQREIAALLGALDDKIELNREMNRTLEAMAQEIFKSWFESIEGERSFASAQALIDRGVLVIGDGYRAKRVELSAVGLPFARAANINDGFQFDGAELLGEEAVRQAGEKISRPLDVVFTSKGTVGRFAMVAPSTPRFAYSPQLCFWRALLPDQLDPHVLFYWMQTSDFLDQVDGVKGQTDMADYVSLRDQRSMQVPAFPPKAASRIGRTLALLRAHIDHNVEESSTLSSLRDPLLPKLLSGEIRLRDAEKAVEKAL